MNELQVRRVCVVSLIMTKVQALKGGIGSGRMDPITLSTKRISTLRITDMWGIRSVKTYHASHDVY